VGDRITEVIWHTEKAGAGLENLQRSARQAERAADLVSICSRRRNCRDLGSRHIFWGNRACDECSSATTYTCGVSAFFLHQVQNKIKDI
jgi:hypothetical protein